jgi:hypothetical protein
MSEFSSAPTAPDAMPVLSRGKHGNPARGACFMEYTALLAGEPFSDKPRCVDGELAAVLRGANDKLSDADRPRLVPLLGRAIGLGVQPPPDDGGWFRPAAERRRRRVQRARYEEQSARLRRAVSRRFMAGIGSSPSHATQVWSGGGEELSWLFWDLMEEPIAVTTSEAYVRRLLARLVLLHECYAQAMDELGLPRPAPDEPAVPAEPVAAAGDG